MTIPTTTKSAATALPPTLNHDHLAPALDRLFALAAAVDMHLGGAGLRGWLDPVRAESLGVLERLGRLRHALDSIAVASGGDSPYVLRPAVAAAPQAPAAGEITGPSWPRGDTGDDDRGPSLQQGDSLGPSSASAPTTRDAEADPRPCYAEADESHRGPLWASQGHDCIAARSDVQTQTNANCEQGERAQPGGTG